MALTITMNNLNFNISSGMNLAYMLTDTPIYPAVGGVYKFRFLIEVNYNIQSNPLITKTISFTQQITDDGKSLFNFSEIYKSIVTPQITASRNSDAPGGAIPLMKGNIHTLPIKASGTMNPISAGLLNELQGLESFKGVANVMTINFYEMFSAIPNGIPAKDITTLKTKKVFMFWGRGQEEEGVVIDFSPYVFTVAAKGKLLSSNYNIQNNLSKINIGKNEYHTISILNKCEINTSSLPEVIRIRYYDGADASGSVLGNITYKNVSANGGAYLSTIDTEFFYLFFGVGLENLQKLVIDGTNVAGTLPDSVAGGRDAIKSFTLFFEENGGATITSITYMFNVVNYCAEYDQSRLSYMNRFGAWEYITLNKERTDELNVKKEYVTTPITTQDNSSLLAFLPNAIDMAYPLDVAKQGKSTTSVSSAITTTMFTDYLNESEVEQIKDLMMSPQIHLLDGENAKALILETSSMKLKREKNRGLYQYELKFKFANPKFRTT